VAACFQRNYYDHCLTQPMHRILRFLKFYNPIKTKIE
jgi:hypothetical protein